MFEEDHKEFLTDRVFDRVGTMVLDASERENAVDLLNELFHEVDLSADRAESLLNVYEYLIGRDVEEKLISLVLALLDGGFSIIGIVEKSRGDALSVLERDRIDLEDDPDQVELVDEEISDLQEALFSQLFGKLGINESHETAPFEGAYVRQRAIDGKKMWPYLKERLAQAFGLSPQAIAAAKAWKKPSLKEKGGGTLESLIEELRGRFVEVCDEEVEVSEPEAAEEVVERPMLEQVYQFVEDSGDCDFLERLKPDSFELIEGKIDSDLRQWIFGIVLLTPEEKRADVRKLIAQFLGCKVGKVAPVTAYLTGGCRERASAEVLTQIGVVEDYIARKGQVEVNGVWEGDPDYDNEAKERGWRQPMKRMMEKAWGKEQPLKGKKMLILDTPRLLEWRMLKEMGGEEKNLTIVEQDPEKAKELKRLLPEATIVDMSLQDWLASIFGKRVVGMEDELLKRKFPVGERSITFKEMLTSSLNVSVDFHPQLLEWMRYDPRFANYGSDFWSFLENPRFFMREAIDIPRVEEDRFDFVSLDTTSKFPTLRRILEALLNLELLGEDGVICTNCVGQREVDEDKDELRHSIQIQQAMDLQGVDWLQFAEGDISDLRTGVSLYLLKMVGMAADQYGHRSLCNRSLPLFKAVSRSEFLSSQQAIGTSIEQLIGGFGKFGADGLLEKGSEKDLIYDLQRGVIRGSLDRAFRLMARKFFRAPFRRLGPKHKKTIGTLACIDPCDPSSALAGIDAACSSLADAFIDDVARKRFVLGHETCTYRGGKTNMLSDFFYAPTSTSLSILPESVRRKMMDSLLKGKPLDGVKGRFLLNAVLKNSKNAGIHLSHKYNLDRSEG
ncbi:hypothetical protein HOG17_05380 [Candidatus Peregrinibacteria bacterium]|jgi:hypothetical protein|nr:hypothetical protein [Candidatus Peregrinibacteria bacterium]MBT4148165.1 hypothetical protein [Candidatus Peregrinibacteria bacterium]MBT4455639.1 hypothetical protein [Candidatus Peregrinibacteria bacterium]